MSLFHPNYAEEVNPHDLVDRMPGTIDAPCHCGLTDCLFPFRAECFTTPTEEATRCPLTPSVS